MKIKFVFFATLVVALAPSIALLQGDRCVSVLGSAEAKSIYGGAEQPAWLAGYSCTEEPSICGGAVTCPGFGPNCPSQQVTVYDNKPNKFCSSEDPTKECRAIPGDSGDACKTWQPCYLDVPTNVCTIGSPISYTVGKCESRPIGP